MSKKITIPPLPPIEIEISSLAPWANWIAVDKSGQVYQYENEPRPMNGEWFANGGCLSVDLHIGTRNDWETLIYKIER